MPGAKATCVFESLQFSEELEEEDRAKDSGVSGRQTQKTHKSALVWKCADVRRDSTLTHGDAVSLEEARNCHIVLL